MECVLSYGTQDQVTAVRSTECQMMLIKVYLRNFPLQQKTVRFTEKSYTWTGNIGASGWNAVTPSATDDNWNLSVNAVGAAYKLNGIDWSKFKNPYLEIKVNELTSGSSVGYKIANEVNTENEYYNFVEDSKTKVSGTFELSNGASLKVDLTKRGLTDTDSIYIGMVDKDFNANVTITLKDSID